ncbi:MAG: DUF1684 domain-containing protein [Actinomycetota bacterium]|nr:DUF1684 domain-containing protein [Actinomycetota bacterium]MDH5312894.1 DUF1684 domain-containing protein [Actinomycetota bacterium]
MDASVPSILSLADWRRSVAELYASIRVDTDPRAAWERWRAARRDLFRSHAQSPIPIAERDTYAGPFVFPFEPSARAVATLEPLDGGPVDVGTSDGLVTRMLRFARARFELFGQQASLDVFWFDQYGGGIYVAFRDATSGTDTYGGGRYLLDTVKGADLGVESNRLILDFNYAYQPSCSYDPRWSCPLPPPENTLDVEVTVGERLSEPVG